MGRVLLVCDLDGTLLNGEGKISGYTRDVLLRAKRAGMMVCFASGRTEQMMSVFCDEIDGCDYLISDNGALARRGLGGRIVRECAMPRNLNAQIVGYMSRESMEFVLYTRDIVYYDPSGKRLQKRFERYEALSRELGFPKTIRKEAVHAVSELGYPGVLKAVAYEEEPVKVVGLKTFVESLPGLRHEATGYGITGVFTDSVSKKSALYAIMECAGVREDEVCVFGDYENDLSLFECGTRRIAVANAVNALKERATFVTKSNTEDGVAYYIERYLLKD